jgi:hypothetical protein
MTTAVPHQPTTKHPASGRIARSSARRLFDVEDVAQNYLEPFSVDRFNQKRMVLGEPLGVTPLAVPHPHVCPCRLYRQGFVFGNRFLLLFTAWANSTEWGAGFCHGGRANILPVPAEASVAPL